MTARLIICDTCAYAPEQKLHEGRTGGEILLEHVEAAAEGVEGVTVERHACLMGCEHSCNVALSSDGKIGYVLGSFRPEAESAEALVEYAAKYAASETGRVPYREWPQGVKGHFVARIPAPPAPKADPNKPQAEETETC